MKKRKRILSFSTAVILGVTLTATSVSNVVFAEDDVSSQVNTDDMSYLLENRNTNTNIAGMENSDELNNNTYSAVPQKQNDPSIIEVPESALYMEGTTVMGITKQWFREHCSENTSKLLFPVMLLP